MKKKINYYLVATALFVAVATMVSMTVINYYLFQKQVKEDLQVMAETIESTRILKHDINEIPQIDVEGIRVTWIDKDGTVLYDNQNDVKKLENHGDRPEVESAFDKGTGDSVRTSATMNSNTFYHAIKLNDGTVLRVSIAARSIWNMFASSIPAMLIVTVIIVGICVVLAKSLTRKLMKPIETLAGNLEQASVIQKKTEYKELVPFMNAIRIQHEGVLAAAKSRQDFTANVSHELKTPLTAISGYAELIENGMVEKEQQIHFATEIRRNAQRLLSLINDIIKLSELDSSEAQQGFEQLDLYGLVKDCMENLQVNAEQRKVALNFDGTDCISQSLSIANTGVNTSKLYRMEQFVDNFPNEEAHLTGEEIHRRLDEIEQIHAIYSPARLGLAAAIACCAFTFLLGGGPIEMMLAFIAAGIGNLIRTKLIKHHFTLFLNIAVSISASCFIYAALLKIAEMAFNVPSIHEAGYICSMLFIIPGFPFITSGIDLAKLDLRSGLERLAYAIIIVMVATMFAWIMALLLQLKPMDFEDLDLGPVLHLILRLIMSFFGVFGFSIMFNSPASMAATAALIGAIANSLRLELVDLTGMPAPAAAFAGALTAGLLASFIKENNGYPRISLTVPSIVIMVPGLYLYRAIYNFGIMALSDAVSWFASAIMIIIALPLGLIFARILTDKTFRYCT